jgi:hypothetical protein
MAWVAWQFLQHESQKTPPKQQKYRGKISSNTNIMPNQSYNQIPVVTYAVLHVLGGLPPDLGVGGRIVFGEMETIQ